MTNSSLCEENGPDLPIEVRKASVFHGDGACQAARSGHYNLGLGYDLIIGGTSYPLSTLSLRQAVQ